MPKIAVLDYRLHPEAQEQIQSLTENEISFPTERCPEEERIQRIGDAEIALVTPWEKIDSELLNACDNLGYIGLCGTSTANIDLEELKKRGIEFSNIVSHTPKVSVAEFFFAQMVNLARGVGEYQWKPGEEHTLIGKKLGIIGLGDVGKGFALVAQAYDMPVSYFSPHRKSDWEDKGLTYKDRSALVEESEIIVVCSSTNVKVLDSADFEKIKNGSILVQACSGSPFEENDFKTWIAKPGNYAFFDMSAGVKNFERYKDLPRVLFSTKVAGDTYESNQRRGQRAIENLKIYLESK